MGRPRRLYLTGRQSSWSNIERSSYIGKNLVAHRVRKDRVEILNPLDTVLPDVLVADEAAGQRTRVLHVERKNAILPQLVPMLVPSLSWQKDRFYI